MQPTGEAGFRVLVESIPGAVYRREAAPPWRFAYVSEAIASIAGYAAKDLVPPGSKADSVLPVPEDLPMVSDALSAAVAAGQPYDLEYRILHTDGSARWIHDRGRPGRDASDRVTWIDGVLFDVTEHKQAELHQVEQRAQVVALMDTIPDHAYFQDAEQARTTMRASLPATKCSGSVAAQDGHRIAPPTAGLAPVDARGNLLGTFGTSRDATGRGQVEDALRYSEIRLRAITDSALDAIVMMDADGCVCYWNPAAERLLGYSSADAMGRDLHSLFVPTRYHAAQRAAFPRFLETGQGPVIGQTRDLEARHRDGHEIPIQLSLSSVEIDGRWHAVGVVRDVTEGKLIEQMLIHERTLLQTLMDQSPDHIYFKDADSRFTMISATLARSFGLDDPSQAVDKTDFDFFTEDHARPALLDEREIMRTGTPIVDLEERETWPDGHETWVSTTKMPRTDDKGNVVGTFGISRDITARKQAQRELREAEDRYRSVVDALAEGIVLQAPDGAIYACNAAAEAILGLSKDQMIGRTSVDRVWRSIHEDGSPFPGEAHPAMVTLATGEPCTGVVMGVHRPDGTLAWISINARPLVRPGESSPYAVVSSFTDITGSKRTQAALESSEKHLRTALDTMLAGVTIQSAVRDGDGRIVDFSIDYSNSAIGIISGNAGSLRAGRTLLELLPAHRVNGLFDAYVRVVETGVPFESDAFRYVDADAEGGQLDQVLDLRAARIGDGYVLSVRDVTRQKQAEQVLVEQRALLDALMDNTPDHIYFKDADSRFMPGRRSRTSRRSCGRASPSWTSRSGRRGSTAARPGPPRRSCYAGTRTGPSWAPSGSRATSPLASRPRRSWPRRTAASRRRSPGPPR
jgi:PAS domain S-box-containing protein